MGLERDLRHVRDQTANRITIGADRKILVREHVLQLHPVDDGEHALEQGLRNLEADEIVVLLRGVPILRNLHGVEAELCFQVRRPVLRVRYGPAVLRNQLRILDGDGLVDCRVPTMSDV